MRSFFVSGLSFLFTWMLAGAAVPAQGDFQKGISYYKQAQFAKAAEEFEQIVKTNPSYEDGHRILGDCYLKTRNYPKAIESFQSALRLKSDNYASYYGLALAYYNSGNYQEAVNVLNKGERLARAPRDRYQLHRTRGSAYYNLKDFNNATADLLKAVSIQRGNASDVLQIGIAYYQLRNFAEADKYLKQALALDPNSSEAKRYLSQLSYVEALDAMAAKNYKQAAAVLSEYLQKNPQDSDAWFNLGLTHLFSDNLKASEQAFLTATKMTPANGGAYGRLGYIYEKNKDYKKALLYYQKAHDLSPDAQSKASVERVQERIRRQNQSS